ncbi:MAG: beta-eliminating lyase-related protein [Mycobacterium sp.]
MTRVSLSTAFASDNSAPAHPSIIQALLDANSDSAMSYGEDAITPRAAEAIKQTFDSPDAEVLFALTGTGANVIALTAATRPWHTILCSDIAHSLVDEAGGPVRLSGAMLTALPSDDGLIDPAQLAAAAARRGSVHHSQPSIVTITQSTENGRLWTAAAIKAFVDEAHDLDLLVHVDGSRIANAVAALNVSPIEAIGDADIVTVGGTKNGLLYGDAILVRRPEHFDGIRFVQKQIGHLPSKHRYVSAQFETLFTDDLWLRMGLLANTMAARLSSGFTDRGLTLASSCEANEVFVVLEGDVHAAITERYAVHTPDELAPIYRFVCSWATTEDDVDEVLRLLDGNISLSPGPAAASEWP